MSEPRVLSILTGPGPATASRRPKPRSRWRARRPRQVHLLDLLGRTPRQRKLADYPILAFIGGFAFGDHLGAGSVFANKIRWRLYDDLLAFIAKGGLALGVCNGFQTMVRLGLLPGLDGDFKTPRATLAPNDRPGYRDAWVTLGFDAALALRLDARASTRWSSRRATARGSSWRTPRSRTRLEREHLVVARYLGPDGKPTVGVAVQPERLAAVRSPACAIRRGACSA